MAASSLAFPLLCMLLLLPLSSAHTAPAADCSNLVANMVDCLSFVTAGGAAQKPEGNCCSGFKSVVKSNAACLCDAFRNSAQLGVTLNVTKALTLPAACHVSAPSLSTCALSAGAAPAYPPIAISPSSVAGAPAPGMGGNDGAPAPSLGSSASSVLTASLGLLVFMATITSFALF